MKKTCKIIKTGVYYGYEYKKGEVYDIVSWYGPYFVFIRRYDPVDDVRYNRMIDWKDVEIDFLFYYFIIMKYLIPIILLLTLTGCSDKSDYIINENIDATNTRIDLVRQAIDRVDNQSTNRYNHLSDEIEIINQQIKNTDETEPQCVPFKVRVGDIVYKDITNDYFSTDDFRKEQGEVLWIEEKVYIKSTVVSYGIELDCATHINELGPDRIKEID